jgi:sarcosine oxidase delta subunit
LSIGRFLKSKSLGGNRVILIFSLNTQMHNSANCSICRGFPVGNSLSDKEFFGFVDACRNELEAKQENFRHRIEGCDRWFYDLADNSLTLGTLRFRISAVGTFSPKYETWLWAWANPDYPETAREASRRIQSLFSITGFRVFTTEAIEASSADAQDFSAMAIHQLDSIGLFKCPSDGPTLYLAVHEPTDNVPNQAVNRSGEVGRF